jgi:mannitol-specific phosphotransferase system IIBC component
MKQRIDNSNAKYIIICDVRFDNEAEFIRSLGGKIIKIERNMESNDGKTTKHSGHITEKGISPDLIDAIIENNASIEEFQNTVKLVVKNILFKEEIINQANHANHFTIDDDIDEVYPRRFIDNHVGFDNCP